MKPRWSLTVLLAFVATFTFVDCAKDKIKLTDLTAITLQRGKITTGRRSAPVQQLRCVGGTAKGMFNPKVVQCINQGHDGKDVQWRCDADLPHNLEFGRISVSCEGYDYADDPFVLVGSCGLEYELDYATDSGSSLGPISKDNNWDSIGTFLVIAFILYVVYAMWNTRNMRDAQNGFRGPGGYPGGGGGYGPNDGPSAPPPPYDDGPSGDGKPPPYGFNTYTQPPSYTPSSTGTSAPSGSSSSGSFWTGAGIGAIGGYLASRAMNSEQSSYPRNRRFFEDTGFSNNDQPTSSTADYHESSGFGGTSRR